MAYVSWLSFISVLIDAIWCWSIMNGLYKWQKMSKKWLVHWINMTWVAWNAVVIWALPNIAFVASYHIWLLEFSSFMLIPALFWVYAYSVSSNHHDFKITWKKKTFWKVGEHRIPKLHQFLFVLTTALHIFYILWHEAFWINLAFAALPWTIILLIWNFFLLKWEHKFLPSAAEAQAAVFILTLAWVVSIAMASWLLSYAWDLVSNLLTSWIHTIIIAWIIFVASLLISSVFDNIVWAAVLWIVIWWLASWWATIPMLVIFSSIAWANCGWMFTKIGSWQWVNAGEVLEHNWEWVSVFWWTKIWWKPALISSIVVFSTLVIVSFGM